MSTYFHGSCKKIEVLENNMPMFFATDEDFAASFAEENSSNSEPVCYLYKLELPDTVALDSISDFGLFDCAYMNKGMIKTEGWAHLESGAICLINPANYSQFFTLVCEWDSAKVIDESKKF